MTKHFRLLALLFVALGLLAVPARATHAAPPRAAITVVDDHGTTVTLAATPHRIISLAPNVTEILYSLGLGREVVGVSSFSDYPAAAKRL
nr:cobalamin-binding protein [Chloroflexota bacterium]